MKPVLYYVHDPMCSWCWGFRKTWKQVEQQLTDKIEIQYILGGLAPDTDLPMPDTMQRSIRETWQHIQQEIPGTEFNFDFWTQCEPRRSTYPACRAIIACRMQQPELENQMLLALQQTYYLQAKNPSEFDILINLAEQLGLDRKQFTTDIASDLCQNTLLEEIAFSRNIDISSFPSLVLMHEKSCTSIEIDYNESKKILAQISV